MPVSLAPNLLHYSPNQKKMRPLYTITAHRSQSRAIQKSYANLIYMGPKALPLFPQHPRLLFPQLRQLI